MQKQELYNKIRTRINELVPRLVQPDKWGNGREYITPHLEDLLEAIGKNGLECEIDESGNLTKDMNHLTFYDLSLSLENQSLETLEALDKLLN